MSTRAPRAALEARKLPVANNIAGGDGLDLRADLAQAYASHFGVSNAQAREVLREVALATADWRHVASGNGVSGAEIALFQDAFEGQRRSVAS